ncbi:MAG: NrfD/PsrC family molybdoenzyme membrane anchor subunit [Dehalococcoidia bacterium]|nr:NrfD/PsrC family molybdoenzyme membrane anchor subunit [Dehalococcoidia bacterium]
MIRRTTIDQHEESLLKPLLSAGKPYLAFCAALLLIVLWAGYAWVLQLTGGLGITAMRTPVGPAWGIYIVNFVFFASMAHGGMAISAAVHLLKAEKFKPIARMGEVLTIVSLAMAGLSIIIDMGRPDRAFNMIRFWPERVGTSPLTWDVTVIVLYLVLSLSFLWLTMRRDLARLAKRFGLRGRLYNLLLIGYKADEDKKVDRLAFWLSIAIVILIVMLSGGVIPWIFGLIPAQAGWFSAMAGPYFLTAALASSLAAVIVVAVLLRKIYHWEDYIKPETFKSLGILLGVITGFYVYLTFAEQLTANYAAPHPELAVSELLMTGELAPLYWTMIIGGFVFPVLMLVGQTLRPRLFSPTRTAIYAGVLIIAFWLKRFFIVIPSLLRPLLPFPNGSYTPTWVEWSIIAGTVAAAVLLYAIFIKVFPIVEAHKE